MKKKCADLLTTIILLSSFLMLLSGCSLIHKRQTLIKEAEDMMHNRMFENAISTLLDAYELDTDNPEIMFLLGESFYRMKKYEEAIFMYQESLRMSPTFYPSLHRLWAAKLQNAVGTPEMNDVKKGIRSELVAITEREGHEPGLLFAACMGYRYLKDKESSWPLLEKLATMESYGDIREAIDSLLFESLLTEKTDERKLRLTELYFTRMPHNFLITVEREIASWILFSTLNTSLTDDDEFLRAVNEYRSRSSSIPPYALAFRLINRNLELEKTVEMLESFIAAEEKVQYVVESPLRALWQGKYHDLLGWAHYQLGNYQEALVSLERSKELYEASESLHYHLGMLHLSQGEKSEAINSFKRSLEINGGLPGAENEISRLLAEKFNYEGKPNEYFSTKENVVTFSDVTDSIGLSSVKALRVAWGDYDNDGYDDLLVSGPRLFKNLRGVVFVDVTEKAGLRGLGGFNGGIWGDYDNDGFLDLYLTSHGTNRLYKNNGNGEFFDVTMNTIGTLRPAPTEAAAWGDMDGDGFLDVYVANYEEDAVELGICAQDRLWRNRGDGTFDDVTEHAGIVTDEPLCGRGITWGDFNNDSQSDILVSNYRLDPNLLWTNRNNLTFMDEGEKRGVRGTGVSGAFGNTIGSVFGDINGDGNLDIVSGNLAHPWYLNSSDTSMILISSGPPEYTFENSFKNSGITYAETHSQPSLADVDNDGDLDLYITSVYSGRNSFLYLNNGDGTFQDETWLSGTRVKNGWGAAFSDFDNDGDVDLAVASPEGMRLLRNGGNSNHWLTVRIESHTCQSKGVGSRVSVLYANKQQIREITAGTGTGTQDSSALTFGLGSHEGVTNIAIRTACGSPVSKMIHSPDQIITITE